jgi:undecaprenyl pyrophosphate synthase
MNTKEEIRKAQEYLAEKKIKHVFSSLLSQVTLFRPKDPIPFFIERLKNGYDKEYVFPRLHLVICPNRELKIVVQAFAFDHNFKLFEEQSNQELKENIEKYMKETDIDTFLLMNTPKTLMDLIPFEKLCHVSM